MPNFRNRFFWQLLIAFILVILLAGGGMVLAGYPTFSKRGFFAHEIPAATTRLWSSRLAEYYAQQGSWDHVTALIAGYPCGPGWDTSNQDWQYMEYVVATNDGMVVASSRDSEDNGSAQVGRTMSPFERATASPIVVGDRQVGLLLLSVSDHDSDPPVMLRGLWLIGLIVVVGGIAIGLARYLSRPLVELTVATRAVAAGDFSVRVPVRQRGEIKELAIAFNTMTERLARADELRRNLTADVAHELRTPLSVVRGKLEGVLDGVYAATPEHLAPIQEEIKLLTRLVEDLHLLSLAEAGQLPLEKHPTDIVALLRDAQVNFSPLAADRGVTLALDLQDSRELQVIADRRRIAQVLGNLLTNALRHTPAGGRVTLSAAASKRTVRVTVADTGAGIPPEDLPHIFERFWRGEKSRSRAGGGAGLGLAIAKYLIQAHGGEIGVASPSTTREAGVGKGTTFYFTLPLASPN